MTSRKRTWEETDDDPTSGLVNLFDIWMVFAVALLVAFVQMGMLRAGQTKNPGAQQSAIAQGKEQIRPEAVHVTQIQLTREKLTGEGQRLGTAYRLKSGQVVYVPDGSPDARNPAGRVR